MYPVFLALPLVVSAPDPWRTSAQEGIHQLASISLLEAQALRGKLARFRVAVDSMASFHENFVFYDCPTVDSVVRTMWFLGHEEIDEDGPMIVEGQLRVIHHRATTDGPFRFPGFVEYRLMDARRVK
jgi:hypothetical protein